MPQPTPRERFFDAFNRAITDGNFEKLTLGKYRGNDATVKKLIIRPVALKSGPHLSFLWRHATRDITKNWELGKALREVDRLLGPDFRDGHLFTQTQHGQLETRDDGSVRVKIKTARTKTEAAPATHDRSKQHHIVASAGWLQELGITNSDGQPRKGQTPKFRQIQKFAEILQHLLSESALSSAAATDPIRIADMGCGKGYLTFATAALLGKTAKVIGIERRHGLVDTCNNLARTQNLDQLQFHVGDISDTKAKAGRLDVLIALHACDTATDDALAAGIEAGASLLVVAPCCQKELRSQLTPSVELAPALRHGIFQERQAEFVTDALRALLLEAVGFSTKVFEFVSTEHTAKNIMIAATKPKGQAVRPVPAAVNKAQAFAQFYGIKTHALARALEIDLG
jgi:protein-L-isoaspartate O-methyltransferase